MVLDVIFLDHWSQVYFILDAHSEIQFLIGLCYYVDKSK